MSDELVILQNEHLEVGIAPFCGGSLAYLRTKGEAPFDLLRPASATALQKKDPNGMAMFPMLPFTHRIKGGKFTYWGITRQVPVNQTGIPDPIHGDGWKTAWTVQNKTSTSVTLAMKHDKSEKGYPFSYEAELIYTLDGDILKTTVVLKNTSVLPMPCGIGLHPFFVKTPNITLRFGTKNVWSHLDDPIDRPYKTPAEWSFETPREIKDAEFDTCFGGFDGTAEVIWPKFKKAVEMRSDEVFNHVVLYTPPRKNFVCLEPTTMANNAFNLASEGIVGTGIQSIGPNETISGSVTFTVRELQ